MQIPAPCDAATAIAASTATTAAATMLLPYDKDHITSQHNSVIYFKKSFIYSNSF